MDYSNMDFYKMSEQDFKFLLGCMLKQAETASVSVLLQ